MFYATCKTRIEQEMLNMAFILKPGMRLVSWNYFGADVGMRVCVCVCVRPIL